MTCTPIVHGKRVVGWICGPGRHTHRVRARCPFCCLGRARTIHAWRDIFGGYCAPDLLCGRCGQAWSPDDERLLEINEEQRARNRKIVSSLQRECL